MHLLHMSSREIAAITGMDYNHVLRDIRVHLLRLLHGQEVRDMHEAYGRTMALSAYVSTNSTKMFKSLLMGDVSRMGHEENQGFSVEIDERK